MRSAGAIIRDQSIGASMEYRRDIDGLRAVAVLAVVFFHAKVPGFSGGFVGVDVFFVISGYLITGLILSDIAARRFSLLNFYQRRIKRIVPALLVVYLASSVLATLLMLPSDIRDFARTLGTSALFVSNIDFYQQAGYFEAPSELKPLLHTWSLSIEEQFYLVWPLTCAVLATTMRRFRQLAALAWTAGAASLVAWLALTYYGQGNAAFFLTPSRVWELMLGAVLALSHGRRPIAPTTAETLAAVGALLIVIAVSAPLQSHPLAACLALPACAGAAMLILSGIDRWTLVSRLLSLSPMVGIGLISYSLYLWHWPLLTFGRYHLDRPLHWDEIAVILGLSLLAAVVSYRLVERPLRRMTAFRAGHVVAAGALCLVAVALASNRMEKDRGWALHLDPAIRHLDATARSRNIHQSKCFGQTGDFGTDAACTFGRRAPGASFDLAVFGDSHANHYVPAISVLAEAAGVSGRHITLGACPALLGSFEIDSQFGSRARCPALPEAMVRFVEQNPGLRLVVLAQAWSQYAGKLLFTEGGRRWTIYLLGTRDDERSESRSSEILRRSLEQTLDYFESKGIQVLLLGEVPPLARDPVRCIANAIRQHRPHDACGRARSEVQRVIGETEALLASLARGRKNVFFFSPSDAMCDQQWCNVELDGVYMYRDDGHLNKIGAERLAQAMRLPERLLAEQ
jgi:peptidoglycan/LPS O-acetylase OafA/YrhL